MKMTTPGVGPRLPLPTTLRVIEAGLPTTADWIDLTTADLAGAPTAIVGSSTGNLTVGDRWMSATVEPLRIADGLLWVVEDPTGTLTYGIAMSLDEAKDAAEAMAVHLMLTRLEDAA